MNFISQIARASLLLLSGFLFSCASATLELHDPLTDKAAIQSGSVAIGGVLQAGSGIGLTDSARNTIAGDLGKTVAKKRRKQDLMGWDTVKRLAGAPPLSSGGSSDLLSRSFSSSDREMMRKGGAKYVLIALVKSNEVWNDISESCEHETEEIRDKEGRVISCITTTTYTTTSSAYRSVRAEYHLYDLSNGSKVWVTSSDHREAHSRSNCSEFHYPRPPQHPAPPSIDDVMKNMSAAAVRKLPKK
ncbi:hypothetical protein VSU19_15565 [Verrucomicrobiales bacterium BCK34]|nr:hypothetical protein [Verrucomicrobiales bacterium BCK34]